MASRVLLISANRCTTPDPVFPLGLAYLNSALRRAGHEVFWLDRLATQRELEETIQTSRPDFVGISLRNIDDVLIRHQKLLFEDLGALGARIRKQTDAHIILGGSGFSIFPRELMELAGADFGIQGEGEGTLQELLAALENGREYRCIPGLVYRRDGGLVINPGSPSAEARELTEADRPAAIAAHYLKAGGMLNVQTQRGCPFQCCYCTYPLIEGRKHRHRPGEIVAAEFETLQRQGARYVFIVDSIFNSTPSHVRDICEALIRRNNKLAWGCFLRPQGLTAELLRLMVRAGLSHIEFGSDSFSDRVLEAYEKDFSFEDVLCSSELARQCDIDHCHYLILGGPGETEATIREGYQNSEQLKGSVILAVIGMRAYPGTSLFERAIAEGALDRNADLLRPVYYLAPGLTEAGVFDLLQEFARRSANWIAGDPTPEYLNLIRRLRERGVTGPLWSYYSALQRLWPFAGEAVTRP